MSKAVLIGALVGGVTVTAAGGGATYYLKARGPSAEDVRVAAEQAERDRRLREEEIQYATVFSSVRRGDRHAGNASMSVIVTFQLAGTDGLGAFCGQLPVVEESVLRALAEHGIEAPVREAVNRSLGGRPVRAVTVRPMIDMAAGGMAARDTESKCRKILKG